MAGNFEAGQIYFNYIFMDGVMETVWFYLFWFLFDKHCQDANSH